MLDAYEPLGLFFYHPRWCKIVQDHFDHHLNGGKKPSATWKNSVFEFQTKWIDIFLSYQKLLKNQLSGYGAHPISNISRCLQIPSWWVLKYLPWSLHTGHVWDEPVENVTVNLPNRRSNSTPRMLSSWWGPFFRVSLLILPCLRRFSTRNHVWHMGDAQFYCGGT